MSEGSPPPPQDGGSKKWKIVIAVLIGAILVMSVIAGIRFLGQPSNNIPANNMPADNLPSNNTPLRAVLKVDGGVTNGYWTRDVSTDLPDYNSTVSYSVSDVGNLDASNVSISISIDGNPYSSNVIPSITTSNSYSSSFSYSTPDDKTSGVLIQASCQDSFDSYTLSIGSTFPSSPYASGGFSPTIAQLYITPNEQNLTAMKNSILKSKFILDPDWTALWTWVGSHITYENEDSARYHWQFPKDTLQSKYGMCADYSTLLVSLYRGGVLGPNDAYVVLGTIPLGNGQIGYHAWVIVRLPIFGWYTLEPQNGFFLVNLVTNPFFVSGYKAQYEFNDQQFSTVR
jgi:transglutaminase-like putative cysteine protease